MNTCPDKETSVWYWKVSPGLYLWNDLISKIRMFDIWSWFFFILLLYSYLYIWQSELRANRKQSPPLCLCNPRSVVFAVCSAAMMVEVSWRQFRELRLFWSQVTSWLIFFKTKGRILNSLLHIKVLTFIIFIYSTGWCAAFGFSYNLWIVFLSVSYQCWFVYKTYWSDSMS